MARTKNRYNPVRKEGPVPAGSGPSTACWKTALYARLSVERDARQSESIQSQLDIMHRFLQGKQEFVIVHEYVDRGWTGTDFRRPAFEELMEDIRSGKINCLVTKDLSRLGRDYLETSNYVETIFPFLGIRYISVNDHFDTDEDANGNKDLEIALKNLVNDLYARDISKRISVSKEQDQRRGRFPGGSAPYGYKVNENDPLRRFVIDPPAAEVVRSIYEMVLQGKSLRTISLQLQKERLSMPGHYLKTGRLHVKEGEEPDKWYIGTLSNILSNEAYIGRLVQGRRKARLYQGEKQHLQDRSQWVVVKDAHEPIISKEVFAEVRDLLDRRRETSCFSSQRRKDIPIRSSRYSGILYCGCCGAKMGYQSEYTDTVPGKRKYSYECWNTYQLGKTGRCHTRITEKVLDAQVMESIGNKLRRFDGGGEGLEKMFSGQMKAVTAGCQKEISRIRAKLKAEEDALEAAYERYVLGQIRKEDYLKIKVESKEAAGKLEQALHEQEASLDRFRADMQARLVWLQGLCAASQEVPDKDLIHLLISRIDVFPGHRLVITWPFGENEIFPEGGDE